MGRPASECHASSACLLRPGKRSPTRDPGVRRGSRRVTRDEGSGGRYHEVIWASVLTLPEPKSTSHSAADAAGGYDSTLTNAFWAYHRPCNNITRAFADEAIGGALAC